MRGNRCEVYINDVKSKLFPLGSSGCRSNLPAALFGMTVSINEAGKEKENITKQRDSKNSRWAKTNGCRFPPICKQNRKRGIGRKSEQETPRCLSACPS